MSPFFSPDQRATLIRGVRLLDPHAGIDSCHDLLIDGEAISLDPTQLPSACRELDGQGLWALPGLIDLQVHFRQPGFEHKETLASGSAAALAGGVTTCVVMPNTRPALDSAEAVRFQGEQAARDHGVRILVAAAATVGLGGLELTDHRVLAAAGAVAISDDGLPLLDDSLMERSLAECLACDLLFMQHAEDTRMSQHHPLTAGPTSHALGLEGQPAAAEGVVVERDIALARRIGARYHVLHTSTKRSLEAIREAKAAGAKVSCEASPHHLLLSDQACAGGDPNFKMNPPLRDEADRQALVAALADGTVDAVATDHAPHSAEEKERGFAAAPFGVIGLETAFAALLGFVHDGTIDATRAVALMSAGPARVLKREGSLGTLFGAAAARDLCLVDPECRWTLGPDDLRGRSKNSAFLGRSFRGRVVGTWLAGSLRYAMPQLLDRLVQA